MQRSTAVELHADKVFHNHCSCIYLVVNVIYDMHQAHNTALVRISTGLSKQRNNVCANERGVEVVRQKVVL